MPVIGKGDRRKRHAMGGVGISPYGLPDHMNFPVGRLSFCNECVQRPSRTPHQVASGLIVFRLFHCDTGGMDDRFHQALGKIVTCIVVLTGEVLLADMIEDIINTCDHLILRNCVGIFGIQEPRHDIVTEYVTDFHFLLMVCNNGTTVHF